MAQSGFLPFTCKVIDRRSSRPAVGVQVMLRCLRPRSDYTTFQALTDDHGAIRSWPGRHTPAITFAHFLNSPGCPEETLWQIGFFTKDYFVHASYTLAELNFTIHKQQQLPLVTLFADPEGYGVWITQPWQGQLSLDPQVLPSLPVTPPIDLEVPISPKQCIPENSLSPSLSPTPLGCPPSSPVIFLPGKINEERYIPSPRRHQKFSAAQNKALACHFIDEPHPSSATYAQLSKSLKLPRDQTKRWFKNARTRNRNARRKESASENFEKVISDVATQATLEVVRDLSGSDSNWGLIGNDKAREGTRRSPRFNRHDLE